jgi:uncharacterized protein
MLLKINQSGRNGLAKLNRRAFLYNSALAGSAFMFQGLVACAAHSPSNNKPSDADKGSGGYGPLQPTKSNNTGETLLGLPAGFAYNVLGKFGSAMSDGNSTPAKHDGMAAFAAGDRVRLVRNQEVNNRVATTELAFGNKALAYDALAAGGTTTLVIDPVKREVIRDFVSLSGTLQNCAGGPTPWGSWITCEETVLGKARLTDSAGRALGGFGQDHGYCFEVPAFADSQSQAVPLKAMGRFVHEAVAVDPATGIVYLTEDNNPAGFYRFIPKQKGKLAAGGKLQMLAVKDKPKYDARTGQKQGEKLSAVWVDIEDPDPADAGTNPLAVHKQGAERGGAAFARLEGCWSGVGRIFFTSTSGGDSRLGQVWSYKPEGKKKGELVLIFESPAREVLDAPDNICVSPRGGLVLCEDGGGEQYLRGLTEEGKIFDLGKNMVPGFETLEWAGATFSPDGQTLFVNIQTPGITFAIWGPWQDGAL